jgi:hypothetical protein
VNSAGVGVGVRQRAGRRGHLWLAFWGRSQAKSADYLPYQPVVICLSARRLVRSLVLCVCVCEREREREREDIHVWWVTYYLTSLSHSSGNQIIINTQSKHVQVSRNSESKP